MKKNIVKFFLLSFALILGTGTAVSAQNFHSKPEAIKNLADASKYLTSTLAQLEETDEAAYKINKEKIRFIKSMITGIKTGSTVEEAANKLLPKEDSHVIQPSVRFIDVSFANTTPQKYIRSEIMFLISY